MPGTRFEFTACGIGELLKRGRLQVPPNQRSYAWEERHVRNLLEDLSEAIGNNADDYFLGTIVVVSDGTTDPSIADGQQRTATTTILLARIRDRLFSIGRGPSARSIDTDFILSVDRNTEAVLPRIKLNLEDNDFFVRRILPGPEDPAYPERDRITPTRASNTRLLNAVKLVEEFIEQILSTLAQPAHADQLLRWVDFIEKRTSVVVVTVPDEVGAFRIFETLNDRGLRASQADILKNYLYGRAGTARLKEAITFWNNIAATIETLEEDGDEWLVTYIRHLWVTSHGPTKERELAAAIKSEIGSETRTMQFLADAGAAVADYVALWSSRHPKWSTYKNTVRQNIDTLAIHLQVEQIRPLLFSVARRFDPEEADKAFRLFVSWSVRFLIFGGRGGLLDTQYSHRAHEVGIGKITKARELRTAMAAYVPTDAQFREAFSTARVSRPHLARYYLRALEKSLKKDPQPEYVANEDVAEINLEHVLPLNPGPEWKVDSDVARTVQRLLGNMVLLRANQNRDIANRHFSEKREIYRSSGYFITQQIANYDQWGLEEIRQRQAELAEIAIQTWPLTFGD
jgi:hypothetical protein